MVCTLVLQPLAIQKRWHNLVGSSAIVVLLSCTFGIFLVMVVLLGYAQDKNVGLQPWVNSGMGGSSSKENCGISTVIQSITIVISAYDAGFPLPALVSKIKVLQPAGHIFLHFLCPTKNWPHFSMNVFFPWIMSKTHKKYIITKVKDKINNYRKKT